jgi:hypothetical protein
MSRLSCIIGRARWGLENWRKSTSLLVGGGGGYISENVFIFALFLFFDGIVIRVGIASSLTGGIIPARSGWPL